eukprot:1006210-Prorocentrum_lima.AAC.1
MSSVLWGVEHSMYVREEACGCYATSYDEEELDIGEVELYLPPVMAHWHESCPKPLNLSLIHI